MFESINLEHEIAKGKYFLEASCSHSDLSYLNHNLPLSLVVAINFDQQTQPVRYADVLSDPTQTSRDSDQVQ